MNNPADLRRARLDRQLSLERLSALTALSPSVLNAIEDGRFHELPAGLYARAYVRTFATAVGLDPASTVRDVENLLPAVPDPLPTLRTLKADTSPGGATLNRMAARLADAVLLCGIVLAIVTFVSLASGIAVNTLIAAGVALAVPCSVPIAAYAILFGAIAGRTPGEWLCNCPARRMLRITVR